MAGQELENAIDFQKNRALWGLKWMRIHFKNNDLYRNLNTIEIKK